MRHGVSRHPWNPQTCIWVDLEVARRRAVAAKPSLAHDSALYRQPIGVLDDLLARGLRVATLGPLVDEFVPRGGPVEDDGVLEADELRFGPPILRPPAFRDFYAFERHVRTMWERRGGEIPEAWYRIPVFYFSNTSEIRGPGDPVWAPRGSAELDFELEVGALVDTPAFDLPEERAEEAIGGYLVLNDWSARDLQRDEMPVRHGPRQGQGLRDLDRAVAGDARRARRSHGRPAPRPRARHAGHRPWRPTAARSRSRRACGRRSTISFGQMLARASADVHLRPGELLGSGTVGGGCLLEVKDETLGRWLEPGDEVRLTIERLGTLDVTRGRSANAHDDRRGACR